MNNITFKQFLLTYNFRYVIDGSEQGYDTQIIRIYPPEGENGPYSRGHEWIEFGIYDFSEDSWKMSLAEKFLNENIMNSYVEDFCVNEKTSILHIYLTNKKERDYY